MDTNNLFVLPVSNSHFLYFSNIDKPKQLSADLWLGFDLGESFYLTPNVMCFLFPNEIESLLKYASNYLVVKKLYNTTLAFAVSYNAWNRDNTEEMKL